jgi:hypothetical protein
LSFILRFAVLGKEKDPYLKACEVNDGNAKVSGDYTGALKILTLKSHPEAPVL